MELEKQAVNRLLEALAPALQAELDRTTQEIRTQVAAELQAEFNQTLQHATDELKSKLKEQLETAAIDGAAERVRLQAELEQWRAFAQAQVELASCTSQPEILIRFLTLAAPFADSVAVYVARAERLSLWKARGPFRFPEAAPEGSSEFYFRPVIIRGRAVSAVAAAAPHQEQALDFLVGCLERSIEVFGLKLHASARPATA
jgi:hypothetical protein